MSGPRSREWDSSAYHRISAPQFSWGKKVLDRIDLRGDEHVLDAGCGTGKLTAELLEMLPRGRALGLDLSQNMLRSARESVPPALAPRISFVAADLLHLPFEGAFDGIFSTATFHWVTDHDALFHGLHRALRPGGWLLAQCGGAGNIDRFLTRAATVSQKSPYDQFVGAYRHSWTYADPATTARRLKAAGFLEIETGLELAPTRFENETQFVEFASKVILHRLLEHFPEEEMRRGFMQEVAALAAQDDPPYELDYVRLNLRARKSS